MGGQFAPKDEAAGDVAAGVENASSLAASNAASAGAVTANDIRFPHEAINSDPIGGLVLPAAAGVAGIEIAGAAGAEAAADALVGDGELGETAEWKFGDFKSSQTWQNQMQQRIWTPEDISETIETGEQSIVQNKVNPANPAMQYTNPQTGKYIVRDTVTKEILQISKAGFKPN